MNIDELNVEIDKLLQTINTLKNQLCDINKKIETHSNIDFTNKIINHKTYNNGKVINQNGETIEIEFANGIVKKINIFLALKNNFITCDDETIKNAISIIIELNKQKEDIEKQIVLAQNKIQELENEKRNILKKADYVFEEEGNNIVIDFNDEEAEDVTNWYKIQCSTKNKNSIKKVLKYKNLYKIFFSEGYTAFGQNIRYARNKGEAIWYSIIATDEKELNKTYYDYIEEFKRNNIDFDGKHIPIFINTIGK